MANVEQYRQLVQTLLLESSNIKANHKEVEAEAIFGVERLCVTTRDRCRCFKLERE